MACRFRHLALLLALAAVAGTATPARAHDGDGGGRSEVRLTSRCTNAASSLRLRLRAEEGWIRIDAEIEPVRARSRWSVVVLHERRLVARVTLAARSGSVELRRTVRDWFGRDTIVVRASAGGATCRASATV
jgi:hypothetical protein